MGYTVDMFETIGKLAVKSDDVLDIGSQDVTISSAKDLEVLNQFIRHKKPANVVTLTIFPANIEAKEVFERTGYRYTNLDVDGET